MGLKRCEDINWDILWEQAIKEKSWPAKNAADWNERAASFARRTEQSPYTETFLSKLNTQPSWSVLDLGSALRRLNAFAIHKVVVTDRVGHGPFDPDAYAAVGHPLRLGPDYIFTVNLLYRMGCLAKVDSIRLEEQSLYRSFDEAVCRYLWIFRELSHSETKRLHRYIRSIADLHENGSVSLHGRHVSTWAFISWHPKYPLL